jgi:hypothetical protein
VEELGGVIDSKYADVTPNITFTEGEIVENEDDRNTTEAPNSILLIVCITLGVILVVAIAFVVVRKIKLPKAEQ